MNAGFKYNANKYNHHDVDMTPNGWLNVALIYGLVTVGLIVGMFIVVYLSKLLEPLVN